MIDNLLSVNNVKIYFHHVWQLMIIQNLKINTVPNGDTGMVITKLINLLERCSKNI